eukprot:COSAG05_NODE_14693_length_390_cov_0.707904_1_plen_47_part_01
MVLSLSVLPSLGHDKWQDVRCKALSATRADAPSEFCPQGAGGKNGDV